MSSQISSTSSSNSDDKSASQYEAIDEAINDYFINHNTTLEQTPRRRRRQPSQDVRDEHPEAPLALPTMDRGQEQAHIQLYNDYFAINVVYGDNIFRRRFRIQKHVFLRITEAVTANQSFFTQRVDATRRMGLSPLQKCTVTIRMLEYGMSANAVDEYLCLGRTSARTSFLKFTQEVIACFGEQYLRRPTNTNVERLLSQGQRRGFPARMMGSIDCMYWEWKNFPYAWKAQYQGRSGKATLILEAVASQDLWIWHSFFGIPGSCNDLNVLYRSPVFDDALHGRALGVNFMVNGQHYNKGYYLTDGIYPQWAAFIQGFSLPQTDKQRIFTDRQAAVRKDVERAFGVLQARFAIIRKSSLAWDEDILSNIMAACIILHNMIVEHERESYIQYADTREFIED